MTRVSKLLLMVWLVLFGHVVPAKAAVIGMLAATPENHVRIETRKYDGKSLLVVKQWSRDCPIQFAPGTPFDPEWRKRDRRGKIFLVLSLYDGAPQTKGCDPVQAGKPSIKIFDLGSLLSHPSLRDGEKDFFDEGAPLYLVFGEQRPQRYDGGLAVAKILASEIGDKARVVYDSKLDNPVP